MKKRNHAGPVPLVWVTLFVAATFALVAGSYAYYRYETNRIRQQKYDEIAAIAKLKAGQVRQWRQGQLEAVEAVAKGPMFKRAINEWLRGPTKGVPREDLTDRLKILTQEMKYVDAILFDLEGHVLLSARPQPEPMNATEEKALQEALAKRSSVLTDLYRTPHGSILMTAVAPLADPNGRPIAVVLLRSDPESFLYPLIQSWPTPSETAETLLVRKDGDDALFLNDLRHRPNSALSLRESLARQELPAVQAVQGRQGILQGRDYRGEEVLADLSPIPGSPWFMVAKVDAKEILAEARYRGAVIAVFAALFILLAASATAYGYRNRQARLYQDLYRSELDQREAQEQFRTILYSIGDAVITTDTRGAVKQMNPVAESVTGWPESEAVGRPLEEVFFIINQETRRSCENPVQKVLQDGQIVGLANHTVLIGRDGTERVLADSGAPIRAENGEISGVVLVFRDVTEQARAADELRMREGMMRAILAASPIGILFTQDRRIKWANDAWAKMLGFESESEYLGQPTSIMYNSEDNYERTRKTLYENLEFGAVSELDTILKRRGGTIFEGNIRVNLVDSADPAKGTISAITDITEKRKAEELLRETEFRYRSLFDNMVDAVAVYRTVGDGDDFLFTDFNKSGEHMEGVRKQEILGRSVQEVFPGVRELGLFEVFQRVWRTGVPERHPVGLYRDERLEGWRENSIYKLPSGDIVAVYSDESEREKAKQILDAEKKRFEALAESSPFGMAMIRQDGSFEYANPKFHEMFGYDLSEIPTGREWFRRAFPDPDYRHEVIAAWLEDMQNATSDQVRPRIFTVKCKDGTQKIIQFRSVLLHSGEHLVTCEDITLRQTAEEALRKSEELLKEAQRVAHIGHWEIDSPTGTPTWSEEIFYIFGLDPARGEPSFAAHQDLIHPDDWDLVTDSVTRGSNQGVPFDIDFRLIRPDKSIRWMNAKGYPTGKREGEFFGMFGTAQDITERKQAQEALRESEEQYRAVFDNAGIGIDLLDPDGRILKVNQALLNILGYTEEELSRLTFLDITHTDDREISKRKLEDLISGEIDSYRLEKRYVTKDGSIVWAELWSSSIRDAYGKYAGTVAVIEDITRRKLTEHALQESEERYRTLFDQSKDGVYMTTRDGKLVEANQACLDLFGFTREEVQNLTVLDIYPEPAVESRDRFRQNIEKTGSVKDYEMTLKTKDGRLIDCLTTSTLKRAPDGTILGYQGILRDVTEYKQLQNQLLQAQKMEAIGTLAGGVAHDFNNLLTVVQGFSELLLAEKEPDDPEYAELQKIFHAARNGADLVQRLLMFSRKAEPKPVPMNLNKQIVHVEKLLRRTIPRMVDISLDLSPDLPAINADPSQIEQVLMNLAVNARDAMPDVGKLTVKTSVVTLDEEYCRLHVEATPGQYLLLEFSDTGHGMDKETVEHIFEPFFTTKEMGRGTGLGLAMVYGIVKQHNGHITVYSGVGKGTTFRVYLPAIQGEEETDVETTGIMPASGTETVLLVDDEEFVRELGARILTKYGYNVLQAVNGREALHLFERERSRISLVILDLIMPEMGGTECLKELLKIDPQVKVLVASGHSADASVKETIQMGAKGFVSKPFRIQDLLRDVRRILDS